MGDRRLAPGCGIVDADRLAGIDRIDAVAHADTGADLGFASLRDLPRDVRVGHVRARHADHVELAAADRMARGGDVLDAGGVKGRQAGLGAYFAGEVEMRGRALAHARNHAAQSFIAVDMALDHIEKVDEAGTGQTARDRHTLVAAQAALPVFVADEPRAKEEIRTDAPPHRLEHRHAETQAVIDRSAIFVGPPIGGGRPELVDEVAVALEFDAIEPAGLHPLGRVGVGGDHTCDVPVLHRLGEGAMCGLAHMGGRDHWQPIVLAPAGAAAKMGDLDHHPAPLSWTSSASSFSHVTHSSL